MNISPLIVKVKWPPLFQYVYMYVHFKFVPFFSTNVLKRHSNQLVIPTCKQHVPHMTRDVTMWHANQNDASQGHERKIVENIRNAGDKKS